MKANEFFKLVKDMRAAQRLYFKTRLNGDLITAKGLESQLDKALKDGLDAEPTFATTLPQPDVTTTLSQAESQLDLITDYDNET